jgi:hypothetical protein
VSTPPDPGVAGASVDVVAGFVGGLLSGVLTGVVSGYFVARTQVAYQLRTATTNEVRKLALEAQRAFRAWIMRPAYGGGRARGDYDGGDAIGEKIDALSSYLKVHDDWLDDTSQESVERILDGLGQHFVAHMQACSSDDRAEEHQTAQAAEVWLTTDFFRLMDKVQALPWWRRWLRPGR